MSRTEAHATTLDRMGGADRYETAAGITRRLIADDSSISTVLLTTGENYPDAMSAGGWRDGAAILLTKRTSIPRSTLALLSQDWVNRVVVIGGPSVIDESVIGQLRQIGLQPTRLWGQNRFETSLAVSRENVPSNSVDTVWIAPGNSFSDQIVAATGARRDGGGFLIVQEKAPPSTQVISEIERIARTGASLRIVDSRSQLTDFEVTGWRETRFVNDPFQNSLETQTPTGDLIVASGENWPDALGGTRLTSATKGLILTQKACSPVGVSTRVQSSRRVTVLGGFNAVSSNSARGMPCPASAPPVWVSPEAKSNIYLSVGMTRSIEYLAARAYLLSHPGQAVAARVIGGSGRCIIQGNVIRAVSTGSCVVNMTVQGSTRPMTINVVPAPLRVSSDRPGTGLLELKPVYIRFQDSPDLARDTNGQIASFVQGVSDSFSTQHPGFAIRVDTSGGVPDVQHIEIPMTIQAFFDIWASEADPRKGGMGPLGSLLLDLGFDDGMRAFYDDQNLGGNIDDIKRIYVGIVESPRGPYRSPNSNMDGGCGSSTGNAFVVYFVRALDGADCTLDQRQEMTYRGSNADWIGWDAFRLLVDLMNGNRDCDPIIQARYSVPLNDRPGSITSPHDPLGYPYAVGTRYPRVLDPYRQFYFNISSGPFVGDACTDLRFSPYLTEWSHTEVHSDGVPGRATADLPDDTTDPQVRVLYVLPADAPDHQWDVNGFLHEVAASANEWLYANGQRSVRFDTFRERLDVGFVRLPQAESALWFRADGTKCSPDEMCPDPRRLMSILDEMDKISDDKIHVIVWGGQIMPASTRNVGCAGAMPDRHAVFMAPMLRSHDSNHMGCLPAITTGVPKSTNSLGLVMIHEIFHVLGGVDNKAPGADGGYHIANNPFDLMGGSWGEVQLDPTRRNYWMHGRSDLIDIAQSDYLRVEPSTLERPIALNIPRSWWMDAPNRWNPLAAIR